MLLLFTGRVVAVLVREGQLESRLLNVQLVSLCQLLLLQSLPFERNVLIACPLVVIV